MDFKDFCADSELEYTLTIMINGETEVNITALSEDSLLEDLNKLNMQIHRELELQYADRPMPIEDEEPDYEV